MSVRTQKLPTVIHNIRAAKGWRIQDMVNWHRMVKPLRSAAGDKEARLDLYPLMLDLCTRFEVAYCPSKDLPPTRSAPEPAVSSDGVKVAMFVDAPEHLSGVGLTIGNWVRQGLKRGHNLRVFTAGRGNLPNAVEFQPVGTLKLNNYAGMNMPMPQVTEVIETMAAGHYDLVHISTPGPMGLLGILAARELGLPVCGTYHTDFPRYAVKLTGDPGAEKGAWNFMRWFYGQMDLVAAPSPATREDLMAHGFPAEQIQVVGRGVDAARFHPRHRDENLRRDWDAQREHKLLYVGRISEEKNLDCLIYSFQQLCQRRHDCCLVLVGDGPYLETAKAKLNGFPAVFTGALSGQDLSTAFASGDLFLFPSETDTFGRVLIEAQSSGLPVLVSGEGGASFAMQEGITGEVLRPMTADSLQQAVNTLLEQPEKTAAYRSACRTFTAEHTPEKSFEKFHAFLNAATPKPGQHDSSN